jgi:hypothetical protein
MHTNPHRRDSDHSTALTETLSRRAALGRVAGTGLAVALLATAGRDRTLAQATPAAGGTGQPPNGFTLDGDGTHINYGTTSIDGRPILSYRGPYGEHSFHGDDIQTRSPAPA